MKTKDGKIVIKNKADEHFRPLMEVPVSHGQSRFDVPVAIKKQVENAGYELRFINEQKYLKDSNHHEKDWLPYTAELFDSSIESTSSAIPGTGISADGRLRRGDSVLAVRPKSRGDEYRAIIKEKNKRNARKAAESQEQLKEEAKRNGFGTESIED